MTAGGASDRDDGGVNAVANVVLVGAGWWGQGWHLPHLQRNERVNIIAIVGERICSFFFLTEREDLPP